MQRWTRKTSVDHEELWHARLDGIDPGHVLMSTKPGSRCLVIQVFGTARDLQPLQKRFGGTLSAADLEMPCLPAPPIPIRDRLRIHSVEPETPLHHRDIVIPQGMAFGTGEHATTATCLRLLCDLAPALRPGWTALDAGTGSGLLAIACERLGASAVVAFDNDPVCIRIVKENLERNRCRRVRVLVHDVRKALRIPKVDVILANLFSSLLIESSRGLRQHLQAGGHLIFSGILKSQIREVCAGLKAGGFEEPRIVTRGKWCAGLAQVGLARH